MNTLDSLFFISPGAAPVPLAMPVVLSVVAPLSVAVISVAVTYGIVDADVVDASTITRTVVADVRMIVVLRP